MPAAPTRYLSPDGAAKLREELDRLRNEERPVIAQRISDALGYGDLSENAEYEEAKSAQAFLEGRIAELNALLLEAVTIATPTSTAHVAVGSSVTIDGPFGVERYEIVGSAEADPVNVRISNASPLGRALLGKAPGAVVTVAAPAGEQRFTVVAIA